MTTHKSIDTEYEPFVIDSNDYWTALLHENQYYLGRFYVWLHRPGKVDFMPGPVSGEGPYQSGLSSEEHKALFKLTRSVCAVINKTWQPDLWNYAWLANHESHGHHGHMHVIPRYRQSRTFQGRVFTDAQWGQNYVPYPDVTYPEPLRKEIAREIERGFYE